MTHESGEARVALKEIEARWLKVTGRSYRSGCSGHEEQVWCDVVLELPVAAPRSASGGTANNAVVPRRMRG